LLCNLKAEHKSGTEERFLASERLPINRELILFSIISQLINRLITQIINRLITQLINRLITQLINRLITQLID
jgi:hypothetical protein